MKDDRTIGFGTTSVNLDATRHKQGYLNTVMRHARSLCERTTASQWLMLVVTLCALLLAMLGEPARLALRYERIAVLQHHEGWRLITAHLVHGDWRHVLLNLAGLWVIGGLFANCFDWRQWLLIASVATLSIAAGFIVLMPQLVWYVGLSGVLHGLLAAGAVAWWQREPRWLASALTMVVIGKLCWEQWQGALPLMGEMPVIVNAHLYGAVGGLSVALWLWWRTSKQLGARQ